MSDEGFSNPTNIIWQGHTGVVEYGGGDRNMVCFFFNKAVQNPLMSAEKGKPVFQNKVYVRIHPPGERLNIVEREATQQDRQRFPMQWEQYRLKKQQQPEGMPIELLYPEQPVVASTLRAAGVQTVEMCADLSGPAIDNIGMGAQTWVNYAQKVLKAADKGAMQSHMRHELEQRDRTIKILERQVTDLKSRLDQIIDNKTMAPDLATIQGMLSNLMARPVHMPAKAFDPQTDMINAQGQAARGGPPKRQRPRIRQG